MINIGDHCNFLHYDLEPALLMTGPQGIIDLADNVVINHGTVISALSLVRIGSGVRIGMQCILADSGFPGEDTAPDGESGKPITIGVNVWLAARVTVMPGVTIGAGAIVSAGSVVMTDIPADVIVGGNPARIERRRSPRTSSLSQHVVSIAAENVEATKPIIGSSARSLTLVSAEPDARCYLITDFTASHLKDALLAERTPYLSVEIAPLNQVYLALASFDPSVTDYCVIWSRPESCLRPLSSLIETGNYSSEELISEVDHFADTLIKMAPSLRAVFVANWTLPPFKRGMGLLDLRLGVGWRAALLEANHRLAARLSKQSNIFLLDASRWLAASSSFAHERYWFSGKIPFHPDVFKEAALDIHAGIRGIHGQTKKLIVLDLDDTLWGGIVGDEGWEQLRLGGHDEVGEAFRAFQQALKLLQSRGVLLAIVSKNDEAVALRAIRSHPEMILREMHFVAWRINWEDKAKNIAELCGELRLGVDSVVFIDDNPAERMRVRDALPEVTVPDWPDDPMLYTAALERVFWFDSPAITETDRQRTEWYKSRSDQSARLEFELDISSNDESLARLETWIRVEVLSSENRPRAVQLLNKTNQMNLSTRRLSDAEFQKWSNDPRHTIWTIRAGDRFGDAGIVGLISIRREEDVLHVVDFLLSCRVFGRGIESAMLGIVRRRASQVGCQTLVAHFKPTEKNKPMLDFLVTTGLSLLEDNNFVEAPPFPFVFPNHLKVIEDQSEPVDHG